MTTKSIGNYLISEGKDLNDYELSITPGVAFFGKKGNDTLWSKGTAYLPRDGNNWWIPSLVSGGEGNDYYLVSNSASAFIADASQSFGDEIEIFDYARNITALFSIEGRHMFFATSFGTNVFAVDALNDNGRIEAIKFMDLSISGSSESLQSFLSNYKTLPDQSIDDLIKSGFFKPAVMGVETASEVRGIIKSLYSNTSSPWHSFRFDSDVNAENVVSQWFDASSKQKQVIDVVDEKLLDIVSSSWSEKVQINRVAKASDNGDVLEGKQRDTTVDGVVGSVLSGGKGSDRIQAMAGWDIVDGGEGNDLVRAGNGRDILTGGSGKDELWGGFGWNTYKGDKDGSEDLLVIKSDEWQVNSHNGKAGNNPDGSKCDIIEALDSIDKIIMQGVNTSDLRFAGNVTGQGLVGIGIYAKGALEALYTGGDLTVAQLTAMTTGDITGPANGTYWSW